MEVELLAVLGTETRQEASQKVTVSLHPCQNQFYSCVGFNRLESADSSMGKVMEKLGKVVHNEGLVEKGRKKRVEKGFGQDDDEVTEKM